MNENELFKSMLQPYSKSTDVVGDEDSPNVYNSVNLPKKIDYSFLHNDIFNLLTQLNADKYSVSKTIESLCLANEFLKKYDWNFLPDDPSKTGQLFIKHVLLSFTDEEIYALKRQIERLSLMNIENENEIRFNTINPINTFLTDENSNKKNEYVMWRKIRGDGNCFYRVVLFAFFEILIFKKDITYLKNFIVDFKMKLKNPLLITMAQEYKIDLHQTFKCLIMIYFSMTSKSRDPTTKTYSVLIKLFNNFEDFDKGLIAYYRILLYSYIDNNREKTLSEDFPIFIGNLLPSEFKMKTGFYDYEGFFQQYLFKFHQIAERIVIYLTPFILGFNIEILYVDDIIDVNTIKCKKSFLEAGDFNKPNNKVIILYKQTHYDLIYHHDYVKKYNKYLSLDSVKIMNNNSICCIICKNTDKYMLVRFKKLGKKEVNICVKCMIKEIKYYIRNLLLYFIQKQKRFFLSRNHEIIKNFLECNIIIGNAVEIHIYEAIKEVEKIYENFTFEGLVKNIKNSLCILCHKQISFKSKFKLILPCNCNLCSISCIKEFYHFVISSMALKEHMTCFCGKIYESWEVHKFVQSLNLYQINGEELLKFYLQNNKDKCYICLNIRDNITKCEIIDNNFTLNNRMVHHFCDNCLKLIERGRTLFKCNFCSAEHEFYKILG